MRKTKPPFTKNRPFKHIQNAITRILKHTEANKQGCWLWTMPLNEGGYARASFNDSSYYVHRISYEIFIGEIKEGFVLDHLCKTKNCVNPCHLEEVTDKINNARSTSPSAINKVKTHCPKGHEYTGENLFFSVKDGIKIRRCKECSRIMSRDYQKRKRNNELNK
jgi:hypothetical protein